VKGLTITLAFLLAACRGEFVIPGAGEPSQAAVADEPRCFVRARFFRGLVQAPCIDIIREVRP
jgi:hypothetical protein